MQRELNCTKGKAKKGFCHGRSSAGDRGLQRTTTAFNGEKKGTILGKGVVNNRMSNLLMQMLEENGVPTHFVGAFRAGDALVKRCPSCRWEVIIRNIAAAGSFSKRFGVAEGTVLKTPSLEYSYKDDELGDPMINEYHILALGLATKEELDVIAGYAFKINELLKAFLKMDIDLVDFKLEFGKTADGTIVLADEISPDTCRFWEVHLGRKAGQGPLPPQPGRGVEAYQGYAPDGGISTRYRFRRIRRNPCRRPPLSLGGLLSDVEGRFI